VLNDGVQSGKRDQFVKSTHNKFMQTMQGVLFRIASQIQAHIVQTIVERIEEQRLRPVPTAAV
jgi:hypothetical protein